jgi:hypothetical protein
MLDVLSAGDTTTMLERPEIPETIAVARRSLSRYTGEFLVITQ